MRVAMRLPQKNCLWLKTRLISHVLVMMHDFFRRKLGHDNLIPLSSAH